MGQTCVLLDGMQNRKLAGEVKQAIKTDADNRISDLHLWRVGPNRFAAIISLVTHHPREPAYYKGLFDGLKGLAHTTIEVNGCPGDSCPPATALSS
jgi:Co/Zn/Cd efflux system component